MPSVQQFLEVRPGLLNGMKLNEIMKINLWKIFDHVRSIIISELNEYSRERGEESREWKLYYERGEEIDLPEDVDGQFERVKRETSNAVVLILSISPFSTPFSHANCVTRGSIAIAQIATSDLTDLPTDMDGVCGPILHELLHCLLVPHTMRGVMNDGMIPEGRRHAECPPVRCMGNIEATILTHHPVLIDIQRASIESPITAERSDANTVMLSESVLYVVVVRNTVAERNIDFRGREDARRRVSRLDEADQLIVCTLFNVKCFAVNSLPIPH